MGRRKKYKSQKKTLVPTVKSAEITKKEAGWLCLLPAVLAIALYANTIQHDYVLDDSLVIVQNEHVQNGLAGLKKVFTTNFLNGVGGFNDGLYRPLVLMSFCFEHALAGRNSPALSHLFNILLYALCGFFLFKFLKRFFKDRSLMIPLILCLLFISHPIHTEAVANIKGRDEILAFLNFILSALFIYKYHDKGSLKYLLLSLLFFLFALLSKENAFTLPLVFPCLLYFSDGIKWKKALQIFTVFTMLAAVTWMWRSHVINSMPSPVDVGIVSPLNNSLLASSSIADRLATAFYLQLMYIGKLIIPFPLLHDYSFNQIPVINIISFRSFLSMLFLGFLVFILIRGIKKRKYFAFGILFFFITIAATSNIFVYIGATFAERFLFVPSMGFAIVLISLFLSVLKLKKGSMEIKEFINANKLFSSFFIVLLLIYSTITIGRNADWENNFTLFAADMPHLKQSARAHYNYGTALFESCKNITDKQYKIKIARQAAAELNKAVAIYPDYMDAQNNLGNAYRTAEVPDSAIFVLSKLIKQNSSYQKAYLNLGLTYFQNGDFNECIEALEQYLKFNPLSDVAAYTIGISYGNLMHLNQAEFYLKKAYTINPANVNAFKDLGAVYGMKGDHEKSLKVSLRALKLDNNDPNLLRNIALTYHILGKEKESGMYLRKAQRIDPSIHL